MKGIQVYSNEEPINSHKDNYVFLLQRYDIIWGSLLVMHFWSAMLLQIAMSSSDADQSPLLMKWYPLPVQYLDFFISVWWSFGVLVFKVSSISMAYFFIIHHFLNTYWKCHWKVGAIWWETLWIQDQTIFFFFKLHPVYVCASWFDETCTTPKVFSHFFFGWQYSMSILPIFY